VLVLIHNRPVAETATEDDPLALANLAHGMVESDTRRAAELAERSLALARARGEHEAEVAALHALGFAQHELGDARAIGTLRAAVRVGERNGLAQRVALVRRPLAIYLAYAGAVKAAVREIDAACDALDGLELARAEVSRLAVLHLAGRAPPLDRSERALQTLRREGDAIWEARLLGNRGFLLAERGDADAAEPDLTRARDLFARLGATTAAIGADYELARIELARGDLPACLARLDAIEVTELPPLHTSAFELLRAKALVAGRLTSEARLALGLAQAVWSQAGIEDPEGRLDAVALTLLTGDASSAYALARRAQRSFATRDSYRARATGLALAAAIAAGELTPPMLRSGRRAAVTLHAAGWLEEALRVRLSVARAAIELGSVRVARRELAACAAARRGAPVADRIEAWHVEALLRLRADDPAGAQRAVRTGLRLLDDHRAALGAWDLRATASEIGVELARVGLRIALDGSNPGSVLAWAETLRASALRLPPVTPPKDPELRACLGELRSISARMRRAGRNGQSAATLIARQATLETAIRRLSRHAAGASVPAVSTIKRTEVARTLGPAALVELIELDGVLTAVTLVESRLVRHELGPSAPVIEELAWLRFALERLTRPRQSGPQRATARAGAQSSADALARRLFAPLADTIGDRSLVIVPTGALHAVPWSILPPLRGRPLVVTPSVVSWLALQAPRRPTPRKVVAAAGPGLRHAAAEVATVSELHAGATTLTGHRATVTAVKRALDGAAIAHLACHGNFRTDSPLFSSLELSDGPLNTYELQQLRRGPDLVVLSACNLAVSDARPGDELLGFAAALIAIGTRTIIASVVPAPDAQTKQLMIVLHRRLLAGDPPAVALARAQARLTPSRYALGGFVCMGTG
jgi:CHAT domain-containing protein